MTRAVACGSCLIRWCSCTGPLECLPYLVFLSVGGLHPWRNVGLIYRIWICGVTNSVWDSCYQKQRIRKNDMNAAFDQHTALIPNKCRTPNLNECCSSLVSSARRSRPSSVVFLAVNDLDRDFRHHQDTHVEHCSEVWALQAAQHFGMR